MGDQSAIPLGVACHSVLFTLFYVIGLCDLFCTGALRKLHTNTGKLKQDVLFRKLGFEEIGVNQRSSRRIH